MYQVNQPIGSTTIIEKPDYHYVGNNLFDLFRECKCNVRQIPSGTFDIAMLTLIGQSSTDKITITTSDGSFTNEEVFVNDLDETYMRSGGNITFEITYSYILQVSGQNPQTRTSKITFDMLIDGYSRLTVERISGFYPNDTIFNKSMFRVVAHTPLGNSTVVNDYQLVGDDGYGLYYENEPLDVAKTYDITCTYIPFEGAIPIVGTTEINVYEKEPYYIVATTTKSKYFIGERFDRSSINVIAYHRYNEFNQYGRTIYSFETSKENNEKFTLNEFGTYNLVVSYSGLTYTLQLNIRNQEQDLIYVFDKITKQRKTFGEIENNYNMSIVLDGTKDSCSVMVYNFESEEIKPNTIVYLPSTDTWWIVEQDMCKYIENEENPLWQHNISLVGAFELLSARDLNTCGFNRDRYTIEHFLNRLMSLTDFEFSVVFNYQDNIIPTNNIYYLKTFENYTPASALKEFFNGYNCVPKMSFTTKQDNSLDKSIITLYSKSGLNDTIVDIDSFDSVSISKTSSKSSFGSRVISNIKNCVSTNEVVYPSYSAIRPISDEYKLTYKGAYLNLPSKVYQALSLQVFGKIYCFVNDIEMKAENLALIPFDKPRFDNNFDLIKQRLSGFTPDYRNEFESYRQEIFETISNKALIEIFNGSYINMSPNLFAEWEDKAKWIFTDKKNYDIDITQWNVSYWEQGSNKIRNFAIFDELTANVKDSIHAKFNNVVFFKKGNIELKATFVAVSLFDSYYRVRYIPMSDIKVKVDNNRNENDTKLYNQNGKLVDSMAVSKLVGSYSKEVSGNSITLSSYYNNFFDIPSIGTLVNDNGTYYVINNISYDFHSLEDGMYFIEVDMSMTPQTSCKSILISANNNIRDYDCPQQNNVKREQLYRDYVEFAQTIDELHNETPYLALDKMFKLDSSNKGYCKDYMSFIKTDYGYYIKATSNLFLSKQVLTILDFEDNNIIGYSSFIDKTLNIQTILATLLSGGQKEQYNTPISYVNEYGETNEISIRLCNLEQTTYVMGEYTKLLGWQPYIDQSIYNNATNNCDIAINEPIYGKDGLEIPVFEYSLQVGDNDDILIGNNFLQAIKCDRNEFIEYYYEIRDIRLNEDNCSKDIEMSLYSRVGGDILRKVYNKAILELDENMLNIELYKQTVLGFTTNHQQDIVETDSIKGKSIVIYCVKCKYDNNLFPIEKPQVLMIINNCKNELSSGKTKLYLSNYRLK